MAKRWWNWTMPSFGFSGAYPDTGFSAPWWTTGMTLVRMLVNVHVSGNLVAYNPLRNYGFSTVIAYIGYDPTEDHTGDTINPLTDPGFDWLYTEQIPLEFSIYQTTGEKSTGVMFGSTDGPRSVEGQRKFGASHVPFFGMVDNYIPVATEDLRSLQPTVYIRALVEDHGL